MSKSCAFETFNKYRAYNVYNSSAGFLRSLESEVLRLFSKIIYSDENGKKLVVHDEMLQKHAMMVMQGMAQPWTPSTTRLVSRGGAGPSEYELGYGTRGNRENEAIILDLLPPDSRTNIPFHPLLDGDPWKIITQELDKDTVETWLPIARLLRLSADQIFLTAVQNLVRKYVASIKKPDVMGGGGLVDKSQWNWDERDANFQLLKDVDSTPVQRLKL
ncbi:hypothetical protein ScPMuIL_013623 [Solemya velum]